MKSKMYSKRALKYHSAIQDNIYNASLEPLSLQALLNSGNGLDVLDLSCGTGIYAQYFPDQGAAK